MGIKCNVAIIGAGYMAREHIRAFQDISGVVVTGLYTRTLVRGMSLAEEFNIKIVSNSIADLYKRANADLVVVCVPELSAEEVLQECFNYSWHVLAEKPIGYNLHQAEALTQLAINKNRNVYVALNRRHYASTVAMLNDIQGDNGARFIKIQDQESPRLALVAGQPDLVVQNWMYANSIHLIDFFTILGRGQIIEVVPIIPWNKNKPSTVIAKIIFDSGDIGLYEATWDAPGPWAVSVNTERVRWELRPIEVATYQQYGQRASQQVPINQLDEKFKPGLRRQAELAIERVSGKANDLPTISQSLNTMRLIDRIYNNTECL